MGDRPVHKRVRISVAAAGLVAALALTGCGDGGGTSPKDGADSATPAGSGAETGSASIEGAWSGKTDGGKSIDLAVTGTKVVLLADGHACTGEVADHGKLMLSLKCADGNTDRTMGTIESNSGKSLVISWDAGAKDTLQKAAAGVLPPGLPTGLPTP